MSHVTSIPKLFFFQYLTYNGSAIKTGSQDSCLAIYNYNSVVLDASKFKIQLNEPEKLHSHITKIMAKHITVYPFNYPKDKTPILTSI